MTLLKVPFHEKDKAKSLGAKWNPELKTWFVPKGLSEKDFSKWIPSTGLDESESMSLSDLLFKVENDIRVNFPTHYWVKAEISNISDRNHLYIDLVEYNSSKIESAKIRGVIWSDDRSRIISKFVDKTSGNLSKGISVLLKATVAFHPRFGMSLNIHDIDPSYTIGAMQAKINEILLQLKNDKSILNNRNLPEPKEFTNVAVISPQGAAGLGDFRAEADILHSSGLCNFHYYHAIFQGDTANESITNAFNQVDVDSSSIPFDAIVLIRGGGSKSDLHFVNEMDIANAIVGSKTPVFVGIGHEQDNGIPDLIANVSFDTPSKVILHIQSIIINNAMNAETNFNNILNNAIHEINFSIKAINSYYSQINTYSLNSIDSSALMLRLNYDNVKSIVSRQLSISKEKLNSKINLIGQSHHSLVDIEKSNLQHIMKSIIQNNPINIIERGFAVIKKGNKYISSNVGLHHNDEIVIKLKDGDTKAIIK